MKGRKKKNQEVLEDIQRMSELEALKFGKLDAEIRNAVQGIQLSNYRKQEYRNEFDAKCKQEDENIASLNILIKKLKPEYEALIEELIKKYNITDRNRLSIDPDTKIIREVD